MLYGHVLIVLARWAGRAGDVTHLRPDGRNNRQQFNNKPTTYAFAMPTGD